MSARKSPLSSSVVWIFMLLLTLIIILMIWLMVRGDGSTGVPSEIQTTPVSGGGAIPAETPTLGEPTEVPEPTDLEAGQSAVIVTTSSSTARLYLTPSSDAPTLDVYQSGVRVSIIEPSDGYTAYPVEVDGQKWYRIRVEDGLVGWMMAENLVLNEETGLLDDHLSGIYVLQRSFAFGAANIERETL